MKTRQARLEQRDERRTLTSHLGDVLREARKKATLTQVDVAERIGLATEVLGRMERGNMLPSLPTLRKLCRVLRVDANLILGLDTPESPAWLEEPASLREELPEMRRLLRALRRMDAAQLNVVHSTAIALLKYLGHKPDDPE